MMLTRLVWVLLGIQTFFAKASSLSDNVVLKVCVLYGQVMLGLEVCGQMSPDVPLMVEYKINTEDAEMGNIRYSCRN